MAWTVSGADRRDHARRTAIVAIRAAHAALPALFVERFTGQRSSSAKFASAWLALGILHIGLVCLSRSGGFRASGPANDTPPDMLIAAFEGWPLAFDALLVATALLFVVTAPWITGAELRSSPVARSDRKPETAAPERDPSQLPATRSIDRTARSPIGIEHLAHRMSHDLRTPLNAVIGFSQIMSEEIHGPVGNARYREYAAHIERSGKEILQATEETLVATRLLTDPRLRDRRTTVDLAVKIDRLCGVLRETGSSRPAIETTFADALPVCCDAEAFEAAFLRLLGAMIISGRNRAIPKERAPILIRGIRAADAGIISIGFGDAAKTTGSKCDERWFPAEEEDLSLCLARAILELQGFELEWRHGPDGLNSAALAFGCAVQQTLPLDAA